ncbi:unnamed protein product, partial [Prorocentrum cordatum]
RTQRPQRSPWEVSQDQQRALFRLTSRTEPPRELRVLLTPHSFEVEEDSQGGELRGEQLETFEQVLSAMDGASAFGSRLCGLVNDQLQQALASSAELAARAAAAAEDAAAEDAAPPAGAG